MAGDGAGPIRDLSTLKPPGEEYDSMEPRFHVSTTPEVDLNVSARSEEKKGEKSPGRPLLASLNEPLYTEFTYGRAYFARNVRMGSAAILGLLIFIMALPLISPGGDAVRVRITQFFLAAIALLLFLYVIVYQFSPLLTSHSLGKRGLNLRMGWFFSLHLPLRTLDSATMCEEAPRRMGAYINPSRRALCLITSRVGTVSLKLREAQSVKLGRSRLVEEVLLSLDEGEIFAHRIGDAVAWARGEEGAPIDLGQPKS